MITKRKIKSEVIKIAKYFDPIAQNTILKLSLQKHVNEIFYILQLLKNKEEARILDVGGGMAVNLLVISSLGFKYKLYLLERFDEYYEGTSMGQFNESIKKLLDQYNINIIYQDIISNTEFPFSDNTFDIITIFDVIEHFPKHPLEVLKEIRRTLKAKGYILLKSPNLFGLFEIIKFLIGRHPYIDFNAWIKEKYYSHYREYTKKEYCKLLTITEFKIKKTIETSEIFYTPATCEVSLRSLCNLMFYLFTTIFYFFRPSVFIIGQKINQNVNV